MKYKIKPTGHIEIAEEVDGKLHRRVIAPNKPVDNDEIKANPDFKKYRTQENIDKYEQALNEVPFENSEPEISLEEKLRTEFDQKLEERVNQIAEAVASGARGQELADKMRKK